MKPILEDIQLQKGISSFYAYRFKVPFFEFKWHYHPEYELTYIIKGNGYRLVGNSYEYYSDGDLILLGSNLPHTWYGKSEDNIQFEAIVIQFSIDFINLFLNLNESFLIKKMIENSVRGLSFNNENNKDVISKIIDLVDMNGMERILKLLSILEELSLKSTTFVASNSFHNIISKDSEMRINKVCLFIQNNFSEKITLKQIAGLIYLSESNFCKFFKKMTGKTFSDYLNSIRITRSCQLLLQTEKSIGVIAFDCGFETMSYFNRVFLKKKGMTPKEFRNYNRGLLSF